MKILNDDYEIFTSGTLYSPSFSDTRFILSETPPMEVVFRVVKSKNKTAIRLEALNDSTLAVVFENPIGLGYGLVRPIKVGHLNGKELYVAFSMNSKGPDEGYDLFYTFSMKEESHG